MVSYLPKGPFVRPFRPSCRCLEPRRSGSWLLRCRSFPTSGVIAYSHFRTVCFSLLFSFLSKKVNSTTGQNPGFVSALVAFPTPTPMEVDSLNVWRRNLLHQTLHAASSGVNFRHSPRVNRVHSTIPNVDHVVFECFAKVGIVPSDLSAPCSSTPLESRVQSFP